VSLGPADDGLEDRVRCLVFRLRRPEYFERLRYSLDRDGRPRLEPRALAESASLPRGIRKSEGAAPVAPGVRPSLRRRIPSRRFTARRRRNGEVGEAGMYEKTREVPKCDL
jgi:hypothetical protein